MKKSIIIFYCLLLYALIQLVSWGSLVVRLEPSRMTMIMGEGAVFLFLIGIGAFILHEALKGEAKLKEQQQNFLLSVTHELKSPLASIKLSLQTIVKRKLDPERQNSLLSNSLKDIDRLDDLVENMLLATKIENKSYSFPKETFNFSEMVYKITDRLQVHSCEIEQIIDADIQPNLQIEGDRFALSSVVTNLIENAIKYSDPCEEIKVILKQVGDNIVFSVADVGQGIIDAEKMLIFDKFYRVGNENVRKAKGTGLGLFIVKEVLQSHDADITVKDNLPRGTIFEVTFG
ncbi:signal transduction histidine kinase [Pedobacter sp. UYP30]|uniref:sensor histidine kinase n=1 Tax=Pedobacter sp. UYP30 TaxID=1756400 RepID=UPI00339B9122